MGPEADRTSECVFFSLFGHHRGGTLCNGRLKMQNWGYRQSKSYPIDGKSLIHMEPEADRTSGYMFFRHVGPFCRVKNLANGVDGVTGATIFTDADIIIHGRLEGPAGPSWEGSPLRTYFRG